MTMMRVKKPTVNQNQISAQTEGSVAPGPHFHCNRFGAPCDGAWQSGAWTNYVVVWSRLWHLQSNILRESYIYNMYNLVYIYIYMTYTCIYHLYIIYYINILWSGLGSTRQSGMFHSVLSGVVEPCRQERQGWLSKPKDSTATVLGQTSFKKGNAKLGCQWLCSFKRDRY